MRYTGRIVTVVTLFAIVFVWHASYFVINKSTALDFFITNNMFVLDFIYTPLLAPFLWWLGKQYDKANYYSEKDILTGAYNRRYVLGVFPKMVAFMDRSRKQVSISIVDIDSFKAINDRFGHDIGDKVLQHVSKTLTENTRKSDIVARWGGDEFLVIASSDTPLDILSMNTRLEYKMNEFSLNESIEVSISIGTAIFPEDGGNLHDLIKKADENMYGLKSSRSSEQKLSAGIGAAGKF